VNLRGIYIWYVITTNNAKRNGIEFYICYNNNGASKPQGNLCEADPGTKASCEQQQKEVLSNP
jgi:hypothetical protein